MSYFDVESCYIAVIVHPKCNLVFFVGVGVEIRMKTVGNGQKWTYDMEKRKRSVQDISTFSN
jgi:hypothetical protein